MDKFFGTPFAATGDKTPVPTTVQPTGSVSYPEGFGPDYQADQTTDPDAKDIPRDSMNQLFFDLSNAMREYQVSGVPDFITSAQNGGTPYSYSINAHVRYNDEIYESRINTNTDLPTVSASWRKISGSQQGNLIADAAGTVNAMTASFTPSLTAYQKGVPLFIRAFGANSSGTPTINVDGLGAITICKGANQPLDSGDIPGAGYWMILQYDTALNKAVLANPDPSNSSVPAGFICDFAGASAPTGWFPLPFGPTNQSRATFARIFAAIGTTWGPGDGTNTFGFPYCPENYATLAANANVGTATLGAVQNHSHPIVPGPSVSGGPNAIGGTALSPNNQTGPNLAAGVRFLKCIKL